MPSFNAANNTSGLNQDNFDLSPFLAPMTSSSATVVYVTSGANTFFVYGSFTSFDANGFPTAGTITQITHTLSGVIQSNLFGFTMDVGLFRSYRDASDEAGFFDNLLSGADSIIGGGGRLSVPRRRRQ